MRRFFLLLSVFFSSTAYSADYFWVNGVGGGKYPSISTACDAAASAMTAQGAYKWVYTHHVRNSENSATCIFSRNGVAGLGSTPATRGGNSCPEGTDYNTSNGNCLPPPGPPDKDCEEKAGKPTAWSLLRPDLNGLGAIEAVCMEGCRVALGSSTCGATGEDPPGVCWGLGSFTGDECLPGDPSSGGSPPSQPDPDDPNMPPTCPPGWSLSGTTCFPNPDPDDPDPNNPDPNNPDPNNPDPNNPNPGGGNGGGDGGGDGGNGDGDGGGNGDGSGDGDGGGGTGDGDDDGPDKGPVVAGEECDRDLKCEGDPIQCAILRQEKQSRCSAEKNADYESNKGKIESLFQGDKFELGESEIEVPGFVQGASRFLPSSCPPPNSFSTSGRTFTMGYEPLCEIASSFSWLFVAAAAFFAAIYVGKAFGGE